MGSIPLPALGIQAPPSAVDQFSKLLEMKSLLGQQQLQQQQLTGAEQENQMRAMQLEDQKTLQTIAPDYVQKDQNGKVTGYDFDGLEAGAVAHGVRPQSLAALQTMRKNAADTLLANANANKVSLENQNTTNDQFRGHLEAVRSAPVGQKNAAYQGALQWAQGQKIDTSHLPTQIPEDDPRLNPWLDQQEAKLAMGSQLVKEAQEKSETAKNDAETFLKQNEADVIKAWKANPQQVVAHVDTIVPTPQGQKDPNYALNLRTKSQVQFALAQGDVDGAKAAMKQASEQMGSLEKEKYTQAQESYRQTLNRQAVMANDLQKNGLSQLDKMFTDPQHGYTQFLAQANSTKTALAEAKDGNELAASLAPLMTVLGVNSFAGIHRVNPQEIAAAGPGVGSLYRQANTILDKAVSGKMNEDTRKEMTTVIDGLIAAKHASLLPAANMVMRNAGLDPTKTAIMDKDGNVTTSDKAGSAAVPKIISSAAIAQAAKEHNVTVEEATKQAKAQGYTVQ